MNTADTIQIHERDNLLVALRDLSAGQSVRNGVSALERVPAKHKVTIAPTKTGELLRMYGVAVARALRDLPAGSLITTDNVEHASEAPTPRRAHPVWQAPDVCAWAGRTFQGFPRSDGRAGTANHWLVIPMVFCENRNVHKLREALVEPLGYGPPSSYRGYAEAVRDAVADGRDPSGIPLAPGGDPLARRRFPNVDGVHFLAHDQGCGGMRQDADNLCRLLASYINHPNVAGATVLSLGCQNAEVRALEAHLADFNPRFDKPLHILVQQRSASESDFLGEAIRRTIEGIGAANARPRVPVGLDKLTIGMECGASDGFSGISGNPCLGRVSDLVVALGGSVILSEFPELHGAEQDLINRCVDDATGERFVRLMRDYNARAEALGSGFAYNPTPGNLRDGLITDAIKSCGAARKGGTSPVVDVQDYPGHVTRPGLTLLCTPGNDVESTTAMVGAGANLLLFSTGLGTPTGNPVAPTLKISTNTELARRMPDIIDYDAGPILAGAKVEDRGDELLDLCLEVAGGHVLTRAQRNRQDDFLPWKRGVSL